MENEFLLRFKSLLYHADVTRFHYFIHIDHKHKIIKLKLQMYFICKHEKQRHENYQYDKLILLKEKHQHI